VNVDEAKTAAASFEYDESGKSGGWKESFRVIRNDGTVVPQPVFPVFNADTDTIEFSLVSDEYFANNDGRTHSYEGDVNGGALRRLTTVTTSTVPTTTPTTAPTTVDSSKDESGDAEGGGLPIGPIAGGGGAVILILVVIIMKKKGGDAGGAGKAEKDIVSFENPMYDDTAAEGDQNYGALPDLYDEPAFQPDGEDDAGYSDLPAGGTAGYMDVDVANDGEDLYNELGEIDASTANAFNNSSGNVNADATYEDVGATVSGIDAGAYDDVGAAGVSPADEGLYDEPVMAADDDGGGYIDVDDEANTGFDDGQDE